MCNSSWQPAHLLDGQAPAAAKRRRQRGSKERQARRQSVSIAKAEAVGGSIRTHEVNQSMPGPLPDLTDRLIKCGGYEEYQRWREAYRRWREGDAKGAEGEASARIMGSSATTEGPIRLSQTWRDGYRSWRKGNCRGARGEMQVLGQRDPKTTSQETPCQQSLPPVVFDAVVGPRGQPAFLPSDGPMTTPILLEDFPKEAIITIRVFRFFEDRADEVCSWEKGLLNVNSGSIFWLPFHLAPNIHSKAGAKYGTWFTVHYVQAFAKHFQSEYHMCNEGCSSGAKTFGSSSANKKSITGQAMPDGYFWYVSPAASSTQPLGTGWQHLDRAGPFDGSAFLQAWQEQGSPMEVRALQAILAKVMEGASKKKLF